MADANLEDFFAKRDKKKKKPGKFEADSVVKILEKKRIDQEKSTGYQPGPLSENSEPSNEYKPKDDDEEWRETVEERPDYTGLKIQELIITGESEEEEEDGVQTESQKEGPWKLRQTPAVTPSTEPESKTEVEVETLQPPVLTASQTASTTVDEDDNKSEKSTASGEDKGGKKTSYIPPNKRREMEIESASAAARRFVAPVSNVAEKLPSSGGLYVPKHRREGGPTKPSASRSKKQLPNINDELSFPTLGS